MDAMNDKQTLVNHFILLKGTLTKHDLLDKPGKILNVNMYISFKLSLQHYKIHQVGLKN